MLKLNFVAVAAVMAAGPALAVPVDAPATFNGPFIGVQLGWQQDRQRLQTADAAGNVVITGKNGESLGYGGQAGYDLRLRPNVVLGVEASVTGRTSDDGLIDPAGNAYDLRLGRTIDATARLGYVVPSAGGLGYVRGGYSNARFMLDDAIARTAFDRDGYTVGVGYEQPVTPKVSARLEYDYSDYGHAGLATTATDYGFADARTRLHRNAVTAGVDLHF